MLFHSVCLSLPCNSVINMKSIPPSMAKSSSSSAIPSGKNSTISEVNPPRPPRSKVRNKSAPNSGNSSTAPVPPVSTTKYTDQSNKTQYTPSGTAIDSRSGSNISIQSRSNSGSTWNVKSTTEFMDPKDILITDDIELHYMEIFINQKICEMEEQSKRSSTKESMVDVVFKIALKEFKSNLLSTYSVAATHDGRLHISYKNLIDHFDQVIMNVCQKENTWKSFPVIMGVNAFRGYLDEFRNYGNNIEIESSSKSKGGRRKRKKKEPREEFIFNNGHKFASCKGNIHTVCEQCSGNMWLTEKIWVCQMCKLTCHKKCTSKVTLACGDNSAAFGGRGSRVFGVPLDNLINDEIRVPTVIDNLITAIELKGLYTEGIYRKSGTFSKISELKIKLESHVDTDLDPYSVHVLTAVLKSFFREMPNPLMTYQLYDDFLWTTAITDPQERVQAIYSHIEKLPRANYDLLERLIFHLARVAQQENANRMNANSLAIVFAPCILRTNKKMQMQDKLCDISKQTVCLEAIINERLKQVKDTLADIEVLDDVFKSTSFKLNSLKMSKNQREKNVTEASRPQNEEEEALTKQMDLLRSEKDHLTTILPTFRLQSVGSDEDLLSGSNEYGITDQQTNFFTSSSSLSKDLCQSSKFSNLELQSLSAENELLHLTKNRVSVAPPNRRLPSRFARPVAQPGSTPTVTASAAATAKAAGLSRNGRSPMRRRRENCKENKPNRDDDTLRV